MGTPWVLVLFVLTASACQANVGAARARDARWGERAESAYEARVDVRDAAQSLAHGSAATLSDPLRLEDVLAYAAAHRQEIVASRARARAAEERPAIASALEDPMVMPSLDHLPFALHGVDASLMIEQRFPLSGLLGHRRRAAAAEARRSRAESERVVAEVMLDAARAFLMLRERREMARVLEAQGGLARVLVKAASARYGAALGSQPEVLRAELEAARQAGVIAVLASEVAVAEAMLNASLGRPPDARVPPLEAVPITREAPPWPRVREAALRQRPELEVARAELGRAEAEISTMEAMYLPMGTLRTGPSYTMSDKWGWMVTLGVTLPIWRGRLDGGVREARALRESARAELASVTRMVEGDAATARAQLSAARTRVLTLRDDLLPRAKRGIDPAIAAYAAGATPLVSVLEATQALWSIEGELVAAELELGVAWARLARAQGDYHAKERR